MTSVNNSILQYETTLSKDTLRRIRHIGHADLLIGIPSHRNGRTIGEVVDAIVEGIKAYLPDQRIVLMNADGGSSDNTVRHLRDAEVSSNVIKLLANYQGMTGKGTGIRAIFEAAGRLGVRACVVIEARAPGIQPEWLPALIAPVLQGDDIVIGSYQRSAYDAALTDNLVYPFLRTFLGADLREPLAGEFCVSGELAVQLAACDVWETNVARFGVNVWLAIYALTEHLKLSQVDLGYRGANGGELVMPADQRFLHTVGTLFRLLTVNRRSWMSDGARVSVPFRGPRYAKDTVLPCEDCQEALVKAFCDGCVDYEDEWSAILEDSTLDSVLSLQGQNGDLLEFPSSLWAKVVYEFATVYNKGEGDPDKVIEALLPIFYARVATFITLGGELSPAQRQSLVQETLDAFIEEKPYFRELWDAYPGWEDDMTRYWIS